MKFISPHYIFFSIIPFQHFIYKNKPTVRWTHLPLPSAYSTAKSTIELPCWIHSIGLAWRSHNCICIYIYTRFIVRRRINSRYTPGMARVIRCRHHGEPGRKIALVVVGVPLRTLHRTAISSCTTMRHYESAPDPRLCLSLVCRNLRSSLGRRAPNRRYSAYLCYMVPCATRLCTGPLTCSIKSSTRTWKTHLDGIVGETTVIFVIIGTFGGIFLFFNVVTNIDRRRVFSTLAKVWGYFRSIFFSSLILLRFDSKDFEFGIALKATFNSICVNK